MKDVRLAKRLGAAIREARQRVGFTQSEVDHRAGLSASATSQAENGTRLPSLPTLMKIATGLGVSASSLVAALEAK